MQGTIKFFNKARGWGFVKADDGKEYFVHYSQIQMDGFKSLHENDMVEYELGMGNGRQPFMQAVEVKPILTRKMIEDSLKEDNLYVSNMKDAFGNKAYMVVDQNNVIQAGKQGMSFLDLAAYAGFDIDGLVEETED